MKTSNNVIIITGAAGGIGSGIAKGLDKSGNVLCLCDNNERILKIKSAFKKATLFVRKLDCGVEEDVISFVQEVVKKYKKIDTLVNCAGVVPYFNVEETEYDIFTNTFKSNVGGYFLFSRAVVPEMKKLGKGNIVNIASISARLGIKGQTAYASTKGAIASLTRVLATELGEYNIRVNSISPGCILVDRNREKMLKKYEDTDFLKSRIPLCRLGLPKDIAGIVEFLISPKASYIHGADIVVDGGQSIV